jgi:hypothetical protein
VSHTCNTCTVQTNAHLATPPPPPNPHACSTCFISLKPADLRTQLPQFCTERGTSGRFTCKPCSPSAYTSVLHNNHCAECHKLRHDNNFSPNDIVYGLCGSGCDDKVERTLLNLDSEPGRHFVLTAVLEGVLCRVLIDTGATTNFISTKLVQSHPAIQSKVQKTSETAIRLGNNTVQICRQQYSGISWIGNSKYTINYLVMPLPEGVDCILGMQWLAQSSAWLHPETKRIVVPNDAGRGYSVLAHIAEITEDDTHQDGLLDSLRQQPENIF